AASPPAAVARGVVARPAAEPSTLDGSTNGHSALSTQSSVLELPTPAAIAVVREAAKPYLVAGLQRRLGRPIVLVAADSARAQDWYQDLVTWSEAPERILHFPAYDALPFEQLPAIPETVAARAGTLIQLAGET